MSRDGIQRCCPKCDCTKINGPSYMPEDNRLRLVCTQCGYWWTTPTKEQTAMDLKSSILNRGKIDD